MSIKKAKTKQYQRAIPDYTLQDYHFNNNKVNKDLEMSDKK